MFNHQGFKRYFANTSWLIFERIFRMGTTLIVTIYVARYLGPENFGLLSYAISFVGLFTAIATLGLDEIVIRELVNHPEQQNNLLGTAFVLKLVGTFLMLGFLGVGIQFINNDSFTTLLIFIIAIATIFQAFNVIYFYFQAKVQLKFVVKAQVIQSIVSVCLKLFLVFVQASLIWFALVLIIDSLVLAVGLSWIYVKQNFKLLTWHFQFALAKKLLKYSWPLIMAGLVISIYMKIDQVMIKEMLDSEAVGNYAAAVKLSEAWYFVPMAITSSLFPAIINAKKVSEEFYYDRLQKLYDLMVWLAIAIALPMTFLSDSVVNLLYGSAYDKAGNVLIIHIWAGVFVFLGVANGKWLLNENLQIYSVINAAIGGFINVVLNYFLIKKYGIYGAAISTIISYAFAAYLCLLIFEKMRKSFYLLTNTINILRLIYFIKKWIVR